MSTIGDARLSYQTELRERARSAGLLISSVAALVVPAWGGFDLLLVPGQARMFITIRLLCDIPMVVCLWLLWKRPLGRQRPELLTFAVLGITQGEIAWMVVRVSQARQFYLLGFSLALYASGCLMGGQARWTAAVVGTTWLSYGIAQLTVPGHVSSRDLVATGFYLSTASVIGLTSHIQRARLCARELIGRRRLQRQQQQTQQLMNQLQRLSHEDPLTGLANRRRWDAELARVCSYAKAHGAALAILLIDIDRFKDINDRHGHKSGDDMLCAVAALLTDYVRDGDLVARLGGDEFGVLLKDTDAVNAAAVAENLRREASVLQLEGQPISFSLGVAAAAGDEAQPQPLMSRADKLLYQAKNTRNSVAV